MLEKDYYKQEEVPPGTDVNILEKYFGSELEPKAKIAIDKIIKQPETLTVDDNVALLYFMDMQRIRVPRQIDQGKEVMKKVVESFAYSIPDVAESLASGMFKISMKNSAKFRFMKTIFGVHAKFFARMKWRVYEAAKDTSYVTTDSPVSLANALVPPPYETAIGLLGTVVFFPLSSTHLLELRHPEIDSSSKSRHQDVIQAGEIEDGYIHLNFNNIMSAEDVYHTNWILTTLANRYVVANNDDALKRLLEDPF